MLTTIACDESGSEGENLVAARHPVFSHGSTSLSFDEASQIVGSIRRFTRTQAAELKSKIALAPRHRERLIETLGPLSRACNIYLVDKQYYVVAKLISLLVAEESISRGIDLEHSGEAANLARMLQDRGERALGTVPWRELLAAYNELIRWHGRSGEPSPTTSRFFAILDIARQTSSDDDVTGILQWLWESRHFAAAYAQPQVRPLREMDPMATSLNTVSMTWRIRLGDVPFEYLADNYWGLDEQTRDLIVGAAREPLSVGGIRFPRADLRAIRIADSKSDPRIQVADLLAGAGQVLAKLAFAGVFDDPLQLALHESLDFNGMWALNSPLDEMSERPPLVYLRTWMEQSRNDPDWIGSL